MTEDQEKPKRPSHLRLVQRGERPPARPKYSADAAEAYLVELTEKFGGGEEILEQFRHHRRLFEQLVEAREASGLSKAEVAKRMGISRAAVERLESGGSNPLFATVEHYVAALGKKIEWHIH